MLKQAIRSVECLPLSTRVVYILSQAIAHLALPLLLIGLVVRARKEPAHLSNLHHRIGLGPVVEPGPIWIYAASLGETRAASPMIKRLRNHGYQVVLSHQSPAGLQEGWRLFPDDPSIIHRYTPLDLFWAVRLFLFRARPAALVVMEIELWPAMLIETARRGVPVVMANGNLLERSMGQGHGFRSWLRRRLMSLYSLFSMIFTRDEVYRDRYMRLNVDPKRLRVVGEMKYDQWIDPAHPPMGRCLRARWPGAERVLMIASSITAEESLLLPMIARLVSADGGLRVLWAPRSPQRFDALAAGLAGSGLTVARRSELGRRMEGAVPEVQVILGDSIGEMNAYYSAADLVFVGASLVERGGHNVVEPLSLGVPVLTGPSTYGIAFAAGPATEAGAMETLPDATALEVRIATLLGDPLRLSAMADAARRFTARKTGAADRTVAGLVSLLEGHDP